MVQAVVSDGAHEALGERVRPWGADGVLIASTPIEANTASNDEANFVSRSRTRKRKRRPVSSRSLAKVRATWLTEGCRDWR
ncbi:MAG: hypothetical protein ACRDYY_01455 [Acidimicrobiales bacterium]